jgi:hypothetical protein
MTTQLKDVLHYYINAPMLAIRQNDESREYIACRIYCLFTSGTEVQMIHEDGGKFYSFISDIKPVLRPFSDVKVEDLKEWEIVYRKFDPELKVTDTMREIAAERLQEFGLESVSFDDSSPQSTIAFVRHFTSKNFDLDGLIESGQAHNATKKSD